MAAVFLLGSAEFVLFGVCGKVVLSHWCRSGAAIVSLPCDDVRSQSMSGAMRGLVWLRRVRLVCLLWEVPPGHGLVAQLVRAHA